MIVFKCLSNYKFSKFYIFAFVKVCGENEFFSSSINLYFI
jgi:hypothetical protein